MKTAANRLMLPLALVALLVPSLSAAASGPDRASAAALEHAQGAPDGMVDLIPTYRSTPGHGDYRHIESQGGKVKHKSLTTPGHKDTYGIKVANLSLGHGLQESASTDPLMQAVETLWDAGIVVIRSAGNNGSNGYGTITSPGNSPKVITVGSMTHWGNDAPNDDITSGFWGD